MLNLKIVSVVSIVLLGVTGPVHAFGLGGSKSGEKFDYEACGKIEEGKTKIDEAEKMLGAKPVTTGKSGGYLYRSWQYTKGGGMGLGAFGVSVGKTKSVQFTCTVNYDKSDVVKSVSMQQIDIGGSSGGL